MEPFKVKFFEVQVIQNGEFIPTLKIPPRKTEYTQSELAETIRGLQNRCIGEGCLRTDDAALIIPKNAVIFIETIYEE